MLVFWFFKSLYISFLLRWKQHQQFTSHCCVLITFIVSSLNEEDLKLLFVDAHWKWKRQLKNTLINIFSCYDLSNLFIFILYFISRFSLRLSSLRLDRLFYLWTRFSHRTLDVINETAVSIKIFTEFLLEFPFSETWKTFPSSFLSFNCCRFKNRRWKIIRFSPNLEGKTLVETILMKLFSFLN